MAPLKQLDANQWLLELFHGPTLAFKDVAMQLLARLMDRVLSARGARVTIVAATSGDTGGAAVEAFRGSARVDAIVLYPQGAELAREAEASLQAGDLPGPLAGLVSEYIESRFSDRDELTGTLYLNASNPLIRRLAERPPEPAVRAAMLTLVHQLARLS